MNMQTGKRQLQNKVAVITGANSGLGKCIANNLADAGMCLVLSGRHVSRLDAVALELSGRGTQVEAVAGDVRDELFCEQLIARAMTRFGAIDVLVNNAGTIDREPLISTTTAEWKRVMETNVDSVFYMCRGAIPHMREEGTIINVASTVSYLGAANLVAYCASKGAVATFTKALAIELAEQKITVNAVAPGAMTTPMLISEHKPGTTAESVYESNRATIPQSRLAEPEEVARAVRFLAEETHLTGSILSIDGGYTAQ